MKVKNVSVKIIGNQSFRLLPGEVMEVKGDEVWVQMYLAEGKLQKVNESARVVESLAEKPVDIPADQESNFGEPEEEKAAGGQKETADSKKKGNGKKGETM